MLLLFSRSVQLLATPWTAPCQASLSFAVSRSVLKPISIESVIPPKCFIVCHPLLLLPSIFPSITVFSNESSFHIRWLRWLSSKYPQTINGEECMERRELSYTVGGNVNRHSCYGEQYGGSLRN